MSCPICYDKYKLNEKKKLFSWQENNNIEYIDKFNCLYCNFICHETCVKKFADVRVDYPRCPRCLTEDTLISYVPQILTERIENYKQSFVVEIKNLKEELNVYRTNRNKKDMDYRNYLADIENILGKEFSNPYFYLYKTVWDTHSSIYSDGDFLEKFFAFLLENTNGDINEKIKSIKILIFVCLNLIIELRKIDDYISKLVIHIESIEGRTKILNLPKRCGDESCKGNYTIGFRCTVCRMFTCDKCMKIQKDEHVCDDKDVKLHQEISKITKPCPWCGVSIQKVDGCPEMNCVFCKCIFDWSYMTVIKMGMKEFNHKNDEIKETKLKRLNFLLDIMDPGNDLTKLLKRIIWIIIQNLRSATDSDRKLYLMKLRRNHFIEMLNVLTDKSSYNEILNLCKYIIEFKPQEWEISLPWRLQQQNASIEYAKTSSILGKRPNNT